MSRAFPLLASAFLLLASSAYGQVRVPRLSTVADLGACTESGLLTGPRIIGVTDGQDESDCSVGGGATKVPCWCNGTEWVTMFSSGGGSGDVTKVGDCPTGDCFQLVGQRFVFVGPTGASGVASFRAITEDDISDLQHTVDTDTAAGYSFTGSDLSIVTGTQGTSGNCAEWNADGDLVDAGAECGGGSGGGTPGGADSQVQYNDGGAFGGIAGALWDDVAEELTIQGTTDAASERVLVLAGPDRTTPAANDSAYVSLTSEWPAQFREAGRITWTTNANDALQSSKVEFGVNFLGAMTAGLMVSAYGHAPAVHFPAGSSATPGINFGLASLGSNEGCYWVSNGIVACVANGVESFRWQQGLFVIPSTGALNFSTDTGMKRGGAARVDVTNGSTGAGSLSALMTLHVPQASAPPCPAAHGGTYFDSSGSGALCACPPGGSWTILIDFGSGNCT